LFNPQVVSSVRDVIEQAVAEQQSANILFLRFPDRARAEVVGLAPDGIVLAALRPASLYVRLIGAEPFVVWFETKGALHWFMTRPIRVVKMRPEFVVRLPARITRMQRRSSFRVRPSEELPARVIKLSEMPAFNSILLENLSQGGVALSFSDDPEFYFADQPAPLELDLGQFGRVKLQVEVRSMRYSQEHRYQVGLEFKDISATAQKNLTDYLSARQREDLKKKLSQ
jgi:c-di-GMP-binding flagellar brake protein YcgR